MKKENKDSEELSETSKDILESITEENFASSNEDDDSLGNNADEEVLVKVDIDEEMYQVIGSKVGTLRFKCSVCNHKSRYKQGTMSY